MSKSSKGQNTRARMIESAVSILREHGAAAVTLDAVIAHSNTPRGSLYYHFPGGRNELLLAAGSDSAAFIGELLDVAVTADDVSGVLDQLVGVWFEALRSSDFRIGCAIVGLAVDARDDLPEAAELARRSFTTWLEKITAIFIRVGIPPDEAPGMATLVLAAIEGAVVLCRVERTTEPLRQVASRLRPLLEAAVVSVTARS